MLHLYRIILKIQQGEIDFPVTEPAGVRLLAAWQAERYPGDVVGEVLFARCS
jgi:hypothetical protein